MGAESHGHERAFTTETRYDPQAGRYVELELPTITVKLLGPGRRQSVRSPAGTTEATFRVTGSHYNLAPGTYSLRVVRVTASVMGTGPFAGSSYQFYARHSRDGTLYTADFASPGRVNDLGHALQPVFSVGPGTLAWGWRGHKIATALGTHLTFSATMEGLLGHSLE